MHGQLPASQAPPQQPMPSQGAQQNNMIGMQGNQPLQPQQASVPPWQTQQVGLLSNAPAAMPVGNVPQGGIPMQSQQTGLNQLPQQQQQQSQQEPRHQGQLPPGSMQVIIL